MIDLRSINKGAVYSLENAHSQPIRDLDFNPNRQYLMATGGDDGCTKFWDIRNIQSPVLSRQDHFHWYVLSWCKDLAQHYSNIVFFFRVWQVRYNVFHDQLILTAGSDARVVLTSAASISSEPFGKLSSDINDEG